jgi:hypothetical protein
MSEDGDVRAVVDQARGVLAELFGVTIATADTGFFVASRRAQGADVAELAEAVVESWTTPASRYPGLSTTTTRRRREPS